MKYGIELIEDNDLKIPVCNHCKTVVHYSDAYDAFYCEKCNEWLDKACNDPFCEFCAGRPKHPLKKEEQNG